KAADAVYAGHAALAAVETREFGAMIEPNNPILSRMLDRLFAAMLNGPSMNCRPHASRQRLDLLHLARLKDVPPGDVLMALLGKEGSVKLAARVPVPQRKSVGNPEEPK